MQPQEGFFRGVRNTNIYYQKWLPEGDPQAVLIIVHGLAEHSGRYANAVNFLISCGFAVHAFDLPGHGKSDGKRMHVRRFEDFTDTLRNFVDRVRKRHPDKKIFLIGHSMGGLISCAYLIEHQDQFAGAVLSGPSLQVPDNVSAATIIIGKVLAFIIPACGLIRLQAADISRDHAVVQAYNDDPLVCKGKVTARLAAEFLKTMQRVTAKAVKITLPLLIIQGGADRLAEPDSVQRVFASISSVDKTINVYDGFYHEVFNEPGHEQVLNDVGAWIKAHFAAKSPINTCLR